MQKQLNKILVTKENIDQAVKRLINATEIGFDTETYGLDWGKQMFSLQMAVDDTAFYFNFHEYTGIFDTAPILDKQFVLDKLSQVFNCKNIIWWAHNAKFDLHRLHWQGTQIAGAVRDTAIWARLENNQHFSYSLQQCLKRIGMAKDDAVEKYIAEHKLYTMVTTPGKAIKKKDKHYAQVPFKIMFEYGCTDALAVLQLGKHLEAELTNMHIPSDILRREEELTKVCAEMEQRGIVVDLDYVKKGWDYEEQKRNTTQERLNSYGNRPFASGPKWLAETFDMYDVKYKKNPKTNNPIFDKAALGDISHPVAEAVKEWRRSDKYIGTYYSSFAMGKITNGVIHANIRTAGTDTGRFSYSDPNLQNVPKEDEGNYPIYVRKCFTPRPDYNFVAIDFRQQEFRLMLDYAGEKKLIRAVNAGEDLHQATADMVGCTRKHAKTINFGLLYGMGVDKLAIALGITRREAQDLKFMYFAKLPRVENFIASVIGKARTRKYIKTYTGRILRFPNKEFSYAAPNHLIQGGCADMMRQVMVDINPQFKQLKSGILVQVHDELLYEIHKDEMEIVPNLVKIMKNVYKPFNGMLMDCSIEVSDKSWGKCDMKEIA